VLYSSNISVTMTNQQSRDNPDPKNIIPEDQKRKQNATDRAQGLDSYFKTVEAMAMLSRMVPCYLRVNSMHAVTLSIPHQIQHPTLAKGQKTLTMIQRTNLTNHRNVAMHWMTRHPNAYTLVMGRRLLVRLSLAMNW